MPVCYFHPWRRGAHRAPDRGAAGRGACAVAQRPLGRPRRRQGRRCHGRPAILDEAGPSNIAGVLQYCIKNNYLGGADKAAGSSLVGKLTGSGQASKDSSFQAGSKGLLDTGGGETFGLGGSGLRKIRSVCDMVLKHAGDAVSDADTEFRIGMLALSS